MKTITMILSFIAVFLIGMVAQVLLDRLGDKLRKSTETKKCCEGCKNLDFWNDGSAFCIKENEHNCFNNSFVLWEDAKE